MASTSSTRGWEGRDGDKTEGRVTFLYRFPSEDVPPLSLRLKVEINSREHFSVYGMKLIPFTVASRWFEGSCAILSYELEEILATKMRALYQRKKGRDLFDLALALRELTVVPSRVVAAFSEYMRHGGHQVSRAQYEENLTAKLRDRRFSADIGPLLAAGLAWDMHRDAEIVQSRLVSLLPVEPPGAT